MVHFWHIRNELVLYQKNAVVWFWYKLFGYCGGVDRKGILVYK